jgi:CheY-like chemotaxis protein
MGRKSYWNSLAGQRADAALLEQARNEFPAPLETGVSRRSFIELAGLSAAALALQSCRAPEQKIIPYVKQPVELTPGVANWYASTCGGCRARCGTLVRVCEGRPVKLEGNPEHPLSQGGLCAAAHGEIFNLYYGERLRQPLSQGKAATWEEIDGQLMQQLAALRQSGGKVRLLTPFIASPTSHAACDRFLNKMPEARCVVYEAISTAAIRTAHERTHLFAGMPRYHLHKAQLVVSFAADFLGTWGAPVPQMRGYSQARDLRQEKPEMLHHVQFEPQLSLTGSNADRRIKLAPAEGFDALLYLAKRIAALTQSGGPLANFETARLRAHVRQAVEQVAAELQQRRGAGLGLCGWNDVDAQVLVNFINHTLGNYGHTLELTAVAPSGNDQQMVELVKEMNDGQVAALLSVGVNPVYDYYDSEAWLRGLAKVPLKIALSTSLDETAALADHVCPPPHFLEAWDDAMQARGVYSLAQPTIAPLFKTRAWQESLLKWSGEPGGYYEFLRAQWQARVFPLQTKYASFDEFWDRALHDGVFVVETAPEAPPTFATASLNGVAERLSARATEAAGKLSLALYEKVTLRDGAHAGIELPVHIQPGQHKECASVALGYGRTKAGKGGSNIGAALKVRRFNWVAYAHDDGLANLALNPDVTVGAGVLATGHTITTGIGTSGR